MVREPPDAVVVRLDGSLSYAPTLWEVRAGLSRAGLPDKVSSVRKMAGGNLYMRLKKHSTRTNEIRMVAETSSGTTVIAASVTAAVEIKGMDGDTTHEDLATALSARTSISITASN